MYNGDKRGRKERHEGTAVEDEDIETEDVEDEDEDGERDPDDCDRNSGRHWDR